MGNKYTDFLLTDDDLTKYKCTLENISPKLIFGILRYVMSGWFKICKTSDQLLVNSVFYGTILEEENF